MVSLGYHRCPLGPSFMLGMALLFLSAFLLRVLPIQSYDLNPSAPFCLLWEQQLHISSDDPAAALASWPPELPHSLG